MNIRANTKEAINSVGGALVALVIIFVFMSFASPVFLTGNNMVNLAKQTVSNGLVACALTVVLISGVIDLSVGSVIGFCSVQCAILLRNGYPIWVMFVFVILMGLAIGCCNGLISGFTPLPPFIITLSMQMIVRGMAYITSGGLPISTKHEAFRKIFGLGTIGGIIPVQVIILLAVAILLSILLKKTVLGQHIYAVGGNKEAAVFAGINVKKIRVVVYGLSGMLGALAAILLTARTTQGDPTAGEGYEAEAIASAVLGGTSFTGGKGNVTGTIIGALLMTLISNGLNLLGIGYYWRLAIQGLLILVAVYADMMKAQADNSAKGKKKKHKT